MNLKWSFFWVLIGMSLGNFGLFLRLSNQDHLNEMLLYLSQGDLSIISGLGFIDLSLATIFLIIMYVIEHYIDKPTKSEIKQEVSIHKYDADVSH